MRALPFWDARTPQFLGPAGPRTKGRRLQCRFGPGGALRACPSAIESAGRRRSGPERRRLHRRARVQEMRAAAPGAVAVWPPGANGDGSFWWQAMPWRSANSSGVFPAPKPAPACRKNIESFRRPLCIRERARMAHGHLRCGAKRRAGRLRRAATLGRRLRGPHAFRSNTIHA